MRVVDETGSAMLDEAVRRLVETFQPDVIYLFGSHPRGDARPDSDYDIMVIVPDSDLPQFRRAQEAYRALWGVRLSLDVLVWTRAEFDSQAGIIASLPAAILREGDLLYAA